MLKNIIYILIFTMMLVCCDRPAHVTAIQSAANASAERDTLTYTSADLTPDQDKNDTPDFNYKKAVKTARGVAYLTDDGIIYTDDGRTFSERTNGIRKVNLKVKNETDWTYRQICPKLTDLEACPTNKSILITASNDGVYLTLDSGLNWQALKSPSVITGLKSVAVIETQDGIRLYVSHAYKGIYTRLLTDKQWTNISDGLIRYGKQYEEIGDIRTIVHDDTTDIYCSTNFTPAIYRLNGDKWETVWSPSDKTKFDIVEDLQINPNGTYVPSQFIRPSAAPKYPQALNKKGIYLDSDILRDESKLSEYITLMEKIGLNAIVFDVKDDDGNLRFEPKSDVLTKTASANEPIDLDSFVKTAREHNIYLIGRLVLFKDKHLYNYDNQRYAVKDKLKMSDASADTTGWQGWYMTKNRRRKSEDDPEFVKRYYKEYWCDPYSTDVWEYNCAIAQEIVSRGVDEIQFDYIRFPTDGDNLKDAVFTFCDDKHDCREGAILSFLHFIRQNVAVPLSIDVYGANGWYRTGGSTGQDVNTLAHYVDVICPMYYPSHFDDDFQAQPPAEDRPYRIYYYGSLRAKHIADYKAIIRPYIQAFKLYTEYDKQYFGQHYIRGQIDGVHDSINEGWTFWDMLDDYEYIKFLGDEK